jgi:hypothetical protein
MLHWFRMLPRPFTVGDANIASLRKCRKKHTEYEMAVGKLSTILRRKSAEDVD